MTRGIKRQYTLPCDGCVHAHACAGNALACDAFNLYLDGCTWNTAMRTPTLKATRRIAAADRKEIRQGALDEARARRKQLAAV
jgi:hypothetical protein